jgi:hypothetical protein
MWWWCCFMTMAAVMSVKCLMTTGCAKWGISNRFKPVDFPRYIALYEQHKIL